MAHLKRRSAFTLVESILSLFILLCIAVLLEMLTQTACHYRLENITPTSDWYLFVEELESSRHSFAVTKVYQQKLDLVDTVDCKIYNLISGKCLYLRASRGGYLPILLNYQPRSVVFQRIDARRVAIQAKTKDGRKHYAIAVFKSPRECDFSRHHIVDPKQLYYPDHVSESAKAEEY